LMSRRRTVRLRFCLEMIVYMMAYYVDFNEKCKAKGRVKRY
jgi:hypothetical protein